MPAKQKKAPDLQVKKLSHKTDISTTKTGWNSMVNWLVVLAVVLPLLFSRVTMDPLNVIRYIFLGWIVLFFLLFFYAVKKVPVFFSLSALLKTAFLLGISYGLWSIMCLLFAINPSESIYETSRYLLNIILLFLVMIAVKEDPLLILKLCKALLIAALIHSLVGLLQYYKFAFMDIPGSAGNPNDPNPALPYGLMANRNLFGSAQVLLLPFVLFVLYKAGKVWKYVGVITLMGIAASIVVSQTRSAWLATMALIITTIILIIRFSVHRKKWIIYTLISFVSTALIIALLLITNPGSNFANSVKVRALSLVKPSPDSFKKSDRLIEWNKSLRLIKDHPVTGVGPGNWKLAITVYGDNTTAWATGLVLPNQPHNVYLQVACETGIPGVLLYFSLGTLIAIMALKIISKTTSEDTRVLIILMLAGLGAFAVDSVFSFPTQRIEHCLYITIIGGIILGFYANLTTTENKKVRLNLWLLIAMIVVAVFNIFLGYKKYSFEKHANLAKTYRMENRPTDVIEEVEKGKNKWVTLDPAGEPLETQSSAAYVELKEFDKALNEIVLAKSHHPNSARIYTTMGVIYANLHAYDKAIQSYQRALTLAPEYEVALKNLASVYFITGNYGACIKEIEKMKSRGNFYITNLYNEAKKRLENKRK